MNWNTKELFAEKTEYETIHQDGNISGILFPNELYKGQPTKVFAYLGIPENGRTANGISNRLKNLQTTQYQTQFLKFLRCFTWQWKLQPAFSFQLRMKIYYITLLLLFGKKRKKVSKKVRKLVINPQ